MKEFRHGPIAEARCIFYSSFQSHFSVTRLMNICCCFFLPLYHPPPHSYICSADAHWVCEWWTLIHLRMKCTCSCLAPSVFMRGDSSDCDEMNQQEGTLHLQWRCPVKTHRCIATLRACYSMLQHHVIFQWFLHYTAPLWHILHICLVTLHNNHRTHGSAPPKLCMVQGYFCDIDITNFMPSCIIQELNAQTG